jgi:hypothetical protein
LSDDLVLSGMISPNGQYEVVPGDYEEIRMGSPQFAPITIRGAAFDTSGQSFGEAMEFSPDSRFFAVEQLVGAPATGPHTRAVVFDFERQRQIIVHDQNPGFIKRLSWSPDGLLTITSWSLLAGEREHTWKAPAPQPTGFFRRIFG